MADSTPKLATCRPNIRTFTGWTILFMVLLRISIGWHFFYEGIWKLNQEDWQATSYLTASSGPLRPVFRWMVRDVDGLERMTKDSIAGRIDKRFDKLADHYNLDEGQVKKLGTFRDDRIKEAQTAIDNPEFQIQLANYKDFIAEVAAMERPWGGGTEYDNERLVYNYGKKNTAMKDLLDKVEKPLKDLEENILKACDQEQLKAGPPPPEPSQTEFIDWANMLALTAVGVCLMLGLFTRLSALGGIGLLGLYYFAMPPWPGLPESPMAEGHYLIINKNLIEMLALFMIMTTRIGRWGGLDAFVADWIRKRRCSKTQTSASAEKPAP